MPKQTIFQVQSPAGSPVEAITNAWDTFKAGSTIAAVTDVESLIVTAATDLRQVTVKNIGADTVYLGPTGLSSADAPVVLLAGEGYSFDVFQGAMYARCAAGDTSSVAVLIGSV